MEKRLPRPIESEKSKFNNQYYKWLHDSHYWIEKSETVFVCEWCGAIAPMTLSHSRMCLKNPEIKKIIKDYNPG